MLSLSSNNSTAIEAQRRHFFLLTAITLTNLGSDFKGLGNYAESGPLLERALDVFEIYFNSYSVVSYDTQAGRALENLVGVILGLNNPAIQKIMLTRLLTIQAAHYGDNDASLGWSAPSS